MFIVTAMMLFVVVMLIACGNFFAACRFLLAFILPWITGNIAAITVDNSRGTIYDALLLCAVIASFVLRCDRLP